MNGAVTPPNEFESDPILDRNDNLDFNIHRFVGHVFVGALKDGQMNYFDDVESLSKDAMNYKRWRVYEVKDEVA